MRYTAHWISARKCLPSRPATTRVRPTQLPKPLLTISCGPGTTTYGLPIKLSNCSNNYGPNHFPEKLIPLAIHRLRTGQPVPVYGKGENVRDWLFVKDHATGH